MNNPFAVARYVVRGMARAIGILPFGRPDWPAWMVGNDFRLSDEELEFPQAYRLLPDIYSATSIVANAIAALPVKYVRISADESETDIKPGEDELIDVLRGANPLETGYELWRGTSAHYLLNGNSYVYDDYGPRPIARAIEPGEFLPVAFWTLPGHLVKPVLAPERRVAYFLFDNGTERIKIPPQQVTHVRDFAPELDGTGMSRLFPLQLTYTTQRDAERYEREFFKRGGMAAGQYSTEQGLGTEELARYKEQLRTESDGPENAFRPVILPRGLKFVRAGLTHAEMQFLEVGQYSTEKILRAFKIPPSLFGQRVGGLGASDKGLSEDMLMFIMQGMKPITRLLEETFNERFFKERFKRPDVRIRFDYSHEIAMQEVFMNQASALADLVDKHFISLNEGRQRIGLPPRPEPEADEILPPKPEVVPEQTVKRAEAEGDQRAALRVSAHHQTDKYVEAALPRVRQLFSRQERRVVAAMRSQAQRAEAKGNGHTESEWFRILDLDRLSALLDNQEDRALVKRLVSYIMRRAGAEAMAELGLELAFRLSSAQAQAYIKKQVTDFITNVNRTTRDEIRAALAEGIGEGETTSELVARIREVFGDARAGRAAVIARTESHAAFNAARLESGHQAEDAGLVKVRKQWLVSQDEFVRGAPSGVYADSEFSHWHADGQTVALDEMFHVGDRKPNSGEKCQYPGDLRLSAGNRINCRCVFVFVSMPVKTKKSDTVEALLAR